MPIMGPKDGGSVLKVQSEPIKRWVMGKFGHPHVRVELNEEQLEDIIRVAGDFIATYFPREQKISTFYSTPLQATYPLPPDAWWVEEVSWDPFVTNVNDIFGTGAYFSNYNSFGNAGGLVLDYHLLSHFRKFSSKILSSEGRWEVIGEVEGDVEDDHLDAANQRIRLIPTPKASFPVVVMYLPCIQHFRSPQARKLCYDYIEAEAKTALGMARRKIAGIPTPDGSAIQYDGEALVNEGEARKKEIVQEAIHLGEPLGIIAI